MKDAVTQVGASLAQQRFNAMKQGFKLDPVIAFAVRDGYLPSEKAAQDAFDGLLQWLAVHAVEEHADHPFVMMNGPVDQAFHALLLNTRQYLHFCRDYVGFFIHHTPLDDFGADEFTMKGGIDYTIAGLTEAFGESLAPALQDWVLAHEKGELSITSVSCVSNGPDRDAHRLIGVADFRTFWDTNPQPVTGTA